ncbi:MAG: hypothetical protein ACE14L_16430 [Terriglobales bacterium]
MPSSNAGPSVPRWAVALWLITTIVLAALFVYVWREHWGRGVSVFVYLFFTLPMILGVLALLTGAISGPTEKRDA